MCSNTNETCKSYAINSMEDLYYGHGVWDFEVPNDKDLLDHTFLYKLPVTLKSPPEPSENGQKQFNESDFVQMPFPSFNKQETNLTEAHYKEKPVENRWHLIKDSLSCPINSSQELQAAIKIYNQKIPEFSALHHFFDEVLEKEEKRHFFINVLPKVIKLAVKLPELLLDNVPVLKHGSCKSISLSQVQIASLLANGFLCTFPWTVGLCPGINFSRLFSSFTRPKREKCVSEKLKTLCHYFERVTSKDPLGVVTFERRHLLDDQLPNWNDLKNLIEDTKIHVRSSGLIEDDADGFMHVDFANKNVGGGVLAYGCVQEEIRFITCPELIVSRLFTEQLGPTEALTMTGFERYSSYTGYGDSYVWAGDYHDTTPFDKYGRKRTSIVAIDATRFTRAAEQYKSTHMLRELNKAYAGFYSPFKQQLPPVATGNWGCGAYKGDPKLKSLIQIMACSACDRDLVYFTFNDEELCKVIQEMYTFLAGNNITVAQLWEYLCWFSTTKLKPDRLYSFILTKESIRLKIFINLLISICKS